MTVLSDNVRTVVKLKDLVTNGAAVSREPQRAYMFDLEIIDNVNGLDLSHLKYYVKDLNVPSKSKDTITVDYMGTKLIWSGKDSSAHEFNVTFWDDEDFTVMHFIQYWFDMTGDSRYGDSLSKPEFTRDIKIVMRPTIDKGSTGTFVLKDCFPTQIGEIALSYDDSNVMEIPVTFSYDYILLEGADVSIIKEILNYGSSINNIAGLF